MNDEQLLRYSRHILLDEFGVEGQERLRASSALIIGAGGLGCPAALYLCSAGVGSLMLADGDRVDATNLQRQILYRADSVGRLKAEAARDALAAINPEVTVEAIAERLEGSSLDAAVARADVVLDCSDNFATRHAANRACVRHRKPLVSGAAIRLDGQLAVFDLRRAESPCYECLFPEASAAEDVQCSVMGVLAPLTGTIGSLQAMEAIKLLADVGEPMQARLLLLDAKDGAMRTLKVRKDERCGVCQAVR